MDQSHHRPFIAASRVEGAPVYNRDGERIGRVDDLCIEKVSGQVAYALVSFGGLLGVGTRYHPVAWSALAYDTDKDGYVISMSADEIEDLPTLAKEDLGEFGGGWKPSTAFI